MCTKMMDVNSNRKQWMRLIPVATQTDDKIVLTGVDETASIKRMYMRFDSGGKYN